MRPAAEIPPLRFALELLPPPLDEAVVEPSVLAPVPRAFAQRARAAAASLARVAGDIGRRRPSCFAPPEDAVEEEEEDDDDAAGVERDVWPPPAPKSELSRSSSDCICSRIDTASLSFSNDRSMACL